MIREELDKDTGAILFKKDSESLKIEELEKRIEILEDLVSSLLEALG